MNKILRGWGESFQVGCAWCAARRPLPLETCVWGEYRVPERLAGFHHEGLGGRSEFGFRSKCDGAHERFSNTGVAGSNLDFNRLVLAVVPGKDRRGHRHRQGDQFRGRCNQLGERCWQLRPEQ